MQKDAFEDGGNPRFLFLGNLKNRCLHRPAVVSRAGNATRAKEMEEYDKALGVGIAFSCKKLHFQLGNGSLTNGDSES